MAAPSTRNIVVLLPTGSDSQIKTFLGLANASTKTVIGLAVASVKTWIGVSNQ